MSGGSDSSYGMAVPEPQTAVVPLPAEIDIANSTQIEAALVSALVSRPAVIVADGTQTGFCDCAGISALISAHLKVAAAGAQLRIAITSSSVCWLLKLIGADHVLDVYPNLASAYARHPGSGTAPSQDSWYRDIA
jgi:anti-anti-sigma factor